MYKLANDWGKGSKMMPTNQECATSKPLATLIIVELLTGKKPYWQRTLYDTASILGLRQK